MIATRGDYPAGSRSNRVWVEPQKLGYPEGMKALVINCTLKRSPETSNTEALAKVVVDKLRAEAVEVTEVRAVDKAILPGVESDMGEGDEWPPIRTAILAAEILVVATPTWLARPAAWTYWNRGPGPGKSYLEDEAGHAWSRTTGETAAQNLVAVAKALAAAPLPVPISE
jgi:hypothetical protein